METALAILAAALAVILPALGWWIWKLTRQLADAAAIRAANDAQQDDLARLGTATAELTEERDAGRQALAQRDAELAAAKASLDERTDALERARAGRQEAEEKLAAESNARADAENRLASLSAAAETRDEELERAREAQETLVKGMAADVLKATREELREQAKADHDQQRKLSAKELEARQTAVEEMVKPIRESLDHIGKSIDEMEKTRQTAYTGLTERVDRLNSETGNLREILRSSQLRGAWGEKSLENILQLAGLRPGVDYETQVSAGGGRDSDGRADFTIRIPGGRRIVVDAKTPFDAYRRAIEADDSDEQQARLEEHAVNVERTAADLAKRRYPDHIHGALNFVVMWIPSDSIVEAAVRVRPALVEDVFSNHRVLIATPVTMLALVTGVAAALEQERFNESALEIRQHAQTIYDGLRRHADAYAKVGRNLGTAVNGYNEGLRALQGNLLSSATKIRDLGGAPAGDDISESEPLDAAVREFTRPALRRPEPEPEPDAGPDAELDADPAAPRLRTL